MTHSVQLLGISNAIVDVLAHVDQGFLDTVGAPPGSMSLIDEEQARSIYSKMGPATKMSGGSVANTIAGFANLGGSAAYIGKVRNDQFGELYNGAKLFFLLIRALLGKNGGLAIFCQHVKNNF